jgi:hypothetical protein
MSIFAQRNLVRILESLHDSDILASNLIPPSMIMPSGKLAVVQLIQTLIIPTILLIDYK